MLKNTTLFSLFSLFFLATSLNAQEQMSKKNATNIASIIHKKDKNSRANLLKIAQQKKWALVLHSALPNNFTVLSGIDILGNPIYTTTNNNTISANTSQTNILWASTTAGGYGLSGSSANMKGKMAIWDGGSPLANHIELQGRVAVKDFANPLPHATHVAGTLMASGINSVARGMAYGLQLLNAYDLNDDISEMMATSSSYLVSNHSYGNIAGWNKNNGIWEFWGSPNDTSDYKFGWYNAETQMFDSIVYNSPYYSIIKSSGNNRDANGPAIGQPYKRFDSLNTMIDAGNRPTGIYSNDGYDIIPTYGCAKNVITVGAVEGITGVYNNANSVVMSKFSSWGPTDDGRIKPDVVAAGVDIVSCEGGAGIASYASYSGTSMATPNVAGSLFLLQELYSKLNGGIFLKAATLKALTIHTANEAGPYAGPDYMFGWGLINVAKAADIIASKNLSTHKIIEQNLVNNQTYTLQVIASGAGKLVATLVWTDPPAMPTTTNILNNNSLKLIHDLDISITNIGNTYLPWILNPNMPAMAATKGNNFRDNVEKIEIDNAIPGQVYTIIITHKNTLQRGYQNFSLLISGIGGTVPCASLATNNSGSRIDFVSFANINNTNPAGCTTLNNFTNLATAKVEAGLNYPIKIATSSCDATTNAKTIKVFIDYNQNGNFDDLGELVVTGRNINVDTIAAIIAIKTGLPIGNKYIMRIVVNENTNAALVTGCNTYSNGETQDYLLEVVQPTTDILVNEIVSPSLSQCANNYQYITAKIANIGRVDVANIALTATIKNGASTIATIAGNYLPTLTSNSSINYTFQTPFIAFANQTYTVTVACNVANDNNVNNNNKTSEFTVAAKPQIASGQVDICGSFAKLQCFSSTPATNYLWYNSNVATTPFANGSTTSNVIAANYYLGSGASNVIGISSKNNFPTGGSYQAKGGNYFKYTATTPVVLESAKLFTSYPGKVTITVADIRQTFPNGSYTYNTIGSTTLNVAASRPTQQSGDVLINDAADTGLVYNINLLLPAGNHILIVNTDSVANIFRNDNAPASTYPFGIANIFTITGNNATITQDKYYYLYNMNIKTLDCSSDLNTIVPTIATVPTLIQVADSLQASNGIAFQWKMNGIDITNATNQKYKPTQSGNYSCSVTDNTGCQQSTANLNIVITALPPTVGNNQITIYPNPAKTYCNIELTNVNSTNFTIKITDVLGRQYFAKSFINTSSNILQKIDCSALASGIYIISLWQNNKQFTSKLLVNH
jgi:Subtilase family/Secretion system C-terminal sorting domain/GEVED domain